MKLKEKKNITSEYQKANIQKKKRKKRGEERKKGQGRKTIRKTNYPKDKP